MMLARSWRARPDVHPVPSLPPREVLTAHAGRFLDAEHLATIDLALDDNGVLTGSSYGVPFQVKATEDGRLAASRSARDFTARLVEEGEALEVEHDAGILAHYRRVLPGAALPADLPGRYLSAEMDAAWTVSAEAGVMTVTVEGPVGRGGPWSVEPILGDIVRFWMPGALFRAWYDVRLTRDAGGHVSGLLVNAGRVRALRFTRELPA